MSAAQQAAPHWEELAATGSCSIRRRGRFVVVELRGTHRVFSTSVRNGGQSEHVRYLVNHQSCEGQAHHERHRLITEQGQEAYHDAVCAEVGVPADQTVLMGTAANMHYAAVVTERDEDVSVTAVVTAGVSSNATCAGDPANWRETAAGMQRIAGTDVAATAQPTASHTTPPSGTPPSASDGNACHAAPESSDTEKSKAAKSDAEKAAGTLNSGTINIMLLVNRPVTASALARAIVTMTEAKSAALQWLAVPSCQSGELATGTGTDQYCVAAPIEDAPAGAATRKALTSTSPHVKLGEIIGRAVRSATLEALRWQNGLEPSYTRGLFHALGRYGVKEQTIFTDLADLLSADDLELLRKNANAAFYEPLAGAAAHALGTVLDRTRHGTIPPSAARDAMVQQAALLAACLAAAPERSAEFRGRLLATLVGWAAEGGRIGGSGEGSAPAEVRLTAPPPGPQGVATDGDPKRLVLEAIALGWREKWGTH